MKITFLGTGTSQGVPVISCPCSICNSEDFRNNRLRTAVWIQTDGASIVIDAGPDFRYQMLRAGVKKLDAIILTHSHKDHIAGLDDVRAYNYFQRKPMDIFATIETQNALRKEFAYIFDNKEYPGVPQINLNTINSDEAFFIGSQKIIPIKVMHYKMEVLGYRIGDFTYITDANYIAPPEMEKMKGSKVLVLNALRQEKHISHYTLNEAIEVAQVANAEQTYFTHISHQLGLHHTVDSQLPKGMALAYDGLSFEI